MLTHAQSKCIRSLAQKKFRQEKGLFVVEGEKMVIEALASSYTVREVYCIRTACCEDIPSLSEQKKIKTVMLSDEQMSRISSFNTPSPALALVCLPPASPLPPPRKDALYLALDGIRDPGNMGTILRLADWFGIEALLLSEDCAELYNPKTVQATMGAIFRVPAFYADLCRLFRSAPWSDLDIYGTTLDGENLYTGQLSARGIIVMGNESHGISPQLLPCLHRRLYIPPFPPGTPRSESLNVAVATAITCAEFRRRMA